MSISIPSISVSSETLKTARDVAIAVATTAATVAAVAMPVFKVCYPFLLPFLLAAAPWVLPVVVIVAAMGLTYGAYRLHEYISKQPKESIPQDDSKAKANNVDSLAGGLKVNGFDDEALCSLENETKRLVLAINLDNFLLIDKIVTENEALFQEFWDGLNKIVFALGSTLNEEDRKSLLHLLEILTTYLTAKIVIGTEEEIEKYYNELCRTDELISNIRVSLGFEALPHMEYFKEEKV